MKCGSLTINEQGRVHGSFVSWAHPQMTLALRPIIGGGVNGLPTHDVIAKAPHGGWPEIGVAWKNKIQKGEKTGLDMYSISLEEPTLFERPLKLAAFPSQADGKAFTLEFDRSKKPGEADQGKAQGEYVLESEKQVA